MRKFSIGFKLLLTVLLLTGCWDQEKLVDKAIVDGISLDQGEDGKLFNTTRYLRLKNKGGGQFEAKDELLEAEGDSIVDISKQLNLMMPGKIDPSKTYVIIIGEELAKQNIYPLIEPFFRSKKSFLGAKIIIAKGQAYNILSIDKELSPIVFDLMEMIDSGEVSSVIPDTNLYSIWTFMIDPGKDMLLPYIEKVQKDKLKLSGIALFNGGKYSGSYLTQKESTMLLLLRDELSISNQFDMKIRQQNEKETPVTLTITNVKNQIDMKVDEQTNQITYTIDITIKTKLVNYEQNTVKEINVKDLNKKTSVQLTKEAKEVTEIIQKANSDALGIGRSVASKYPKLWNEKKWKEEYQKVKIVPKIKVEITQTGTLN